MKIKIVCLDYGHGGNDLGAVYRGNIESRHNIILGRAIAKNLRKYGIKVIETRYGDSFISLESRVKKANEARVDLFLSIHRNAFIPGRASGVEAFTHIKTSKETIKLADRILRSLEKFGFKNRGVKRSNFYVLKKTVAPAILLEVGFIDNNLDNHIFKERLYDIANSISKQVVENYKLEG